MNRFFLILSLLILAQNSHSQREASYAWPVKIPIFLSSSYGELRSGHFHSGIDIKTDGVEGKAILAIEDGYVSRIKISPYGYGKAIYIDHPTGHTSVYGHLKVLNNNIEAYTQKVQYENRSFNIDHYPDSNALIVKKGELIAYSGNTGRSGGPHLHFEIRDTKSEIPLNPFWFYKYHDTTPPLLNKFYIYSQVSGLKKTYNSSDKQDIIVVDKEFGIGISAIDKINGSNNKCGIYQIKAFIDSTLFYHAIIDSISFFDTHYINSYMDFKSYVSNKKKIHKLFIESNNELKTYKKAINKGIIRLTDSAVHDVKCIVYDFHLNKTELIFRVQQGQNNNYGIIDCDTTLPYDKSYLQNTKEYIIDIPAYTLIDSTCFNISKNSVKKYPNMYSSIYNFGNYTIPAFKEFSVYIKHDSISVGYEKFLLLANINKNGKIFNTKSDYTDGYVGANVKSFGNYAVFMDTIPPKIRAINISDKKNMSSETKIKIQITDNLSGIDKYYCYIDGKWVLFEYNPAKATIEYTFDKHVIKNGEAHSLFLEVYDERGNKSVYNIKFLY